MAGLRHGLRMVAAEKGEWAGIPIPLETHRLVIEPSYPWAEALSSMGGGAPKEGSDPDAGWTKINSWYSTRHRCDIILMRSPEGRIEWGKLAAFHHISHDLQTLGASDAWGIEQEANAMELLSGLISARAMKQYVMTGMFLETSERSRVTYLFRRLKPTIACAPGRRPEDSMRILAALCMHPIAYYAGSWAGAMTPTDDVVAHLMMMRGDEHMFWKRCNQHPPYRPEAGL